MYPLEQSVKYIKGVGPAKAEVLQKEFKVFTVRDLLFQFPFRHIDKTEFQKIVNAQFGQIVQLSGVLVGLEKKQGKRRSRLEGYFKDDTGIIQLVWFQGIRWIEKGIKPGEKYTVYGKVGHYQGIKNIAHPEMELIADLADTKPSKYDPVYSSTEKLDAKGLGSDVRRRLIKGILSELSPDQFPENLPVDLLLKLKLCSRAESLFWIHFPATQEELSRATLRLKFEEIFFLQMQLIRSRQHRKQKLSGIVFHKIGDLFHNFYSDVLPFELTAAQKRAIREIRADLGSGAQMNRLLQGDVGSGKTIVAILTMLIALDNGYQACIMAPTEILAFQHHESISGLLGSLDIAVGYLSGQVTGKKREELLESLKEGQIDILVGTHALIESTVIFKNLGLAITDEQHRFGVAQRAKLWLKTADKPPHILVMTATPIPRTLSMTVYGDLDVSVIDELPPGRKPIKTIHRRETYRAQVVGFMHRQIAKGSQVYVVFPLIEESEKLDLQNLQDGYEQLLQFFPRPDFQIGVVHGRMKAADKEMEMNRFVKGESQILVSTTVIEVGVDVPNASVMVIENSERFGLSQLHQLRGRVGRGKEQSFCILMTGFKLTREAKERIRTMVKTQNGFEIAEVDLKLRGPGELEGTRQSGVKEFKIFDLIRDTKILQAARQMAIRICDIDPELSSDKNKPLAKYLAEMAKKKKGWGRIG